MYYHCKNFMYILIDPTFFLTLTSFFSLMNKFHEWASFFTSCTIQSIAIYFLSTTTALRLLSFPPPKSHIYFLALFLFHLLAAFDPIDWVFLFSLCSLTTSTLTYCSLIYYFLSSLTSLSSNILLFLLKIVSPHLLHPPSPFHMVKSNSSIRWPFKCHLY